MSRGGDWHSVEGVTLEWWEGVELAFMESIRAHVVKFFGHLQLITQASVCMSVT